MSTPSEFELDLDLQLLPAWARQPSTDNRYAKFEGDSGSDHPGRRDRFERRDRPPRRRDAGGGPGGPGGPRGDRDTRSRPPHRDDRSQRPLPPREPEIPLPEVDVAFTPEELGVESLARQIRLTGRAYPLFDIAQLVLQKPERFHVTFSIRKGPDGAPLQPLFACSLDDSLWLSEAEVAAHVLRNHFATFYQTEKVAAEPPKGTYTLVAQCGISGVILGPPNLHDYQDKLRKLHAERFSRMPFEAFRSRVKMVKDEAVVKQWVEQQSWKTEYVALNVPEAIKFTSRDEVERHFRETFLPNLVKPVETFKLPAGAPKRILAPALQSLLRRTHDEQRRFPLRVATVLSQQFARHGLQFFKVNKTVTHVCVARPHYLDLTTTIVSDGVRRIVDYINSHPGCTRKKLLETLAPTPPASPTPPAEPKPVEPASADAPAAQAAPAPTPPPAPVPTPEQTAIITDLHWLIHQGHVIEFTNGRMETAKQPAPKPPKPPTPAKPEAAAAPAPATPAETAETAETATDTTASPAALALESKPAAAEAAGVVAPAEAPAPAEPLATSQPTPPPANPPTVASPIEGAAPPASAASEPTPPAA
jgi:hypothetical protein